MTEMNRFTSYSLLGVILAIGLLPTGCGSQENGPQHKPAQEGVSQTDIAPQQEKISKMDKYLVSLETTKGNIVIELDASAPLTVENFCDYINNELRVFVSRSRHQNFLGLNRGR